MAKKVVKKRVAVKSKVIKGKKKPSVKKAPSKKGKKIASVKKPVSKKITLKKTVKKKIVSQKETQEREANKIVNSEKKKHFGRKKLGEKSSVSNRPFKTSTSKEVTSLLDAIVEGMQEKKAHNIIIINLSEIENRAFDYFVICDADSKTQVEAIADSVQETVENKIKEKPFHTEGFQNAEWILIDYINIVAHVFQKETRDYYNVESLWADAEFKLISN